MRIDNLRVSAFLNDPGLCRLVLLHGDDAGLVRHRADVLTRTVAGSADDPFRVVNITRDIVTALMAEARSFPLNGGRRVIRVHEVSDGVTEVVRSVMASTAALIVLESSNLPARSKLRALAEQADLGASVSCNRLQGRELESAVRTAISSFGKQIEPDALRWVCGQLASDFADVEGCARTLATYAGTEGTVDLGMSMACVGDRLESTLDNAFAAAARGDVVAIDRAIEDAFRDGQSATSVLRSAISFMQRVLRKRTERGSGGAADKSPRPSWNSATASDLPLAFTTLSIEHALDALLECEFSCKQTGFPSAVWVRHHLLHLLNRQPFEKVTPVQALVD